MVRACVNGYSDSLFDQTVLSVQSGYWAAYYTNAKHPKPLKMVIADMLRRKDQARQTNTKQVVKPEVDVEAFLATEEAFLKRLKAK